MPSHRAPQLEEVIAFAALMLFMSFTRASGAAMTTVGDPANPAGLQKAIQDAYANGARKIVIAKGVYHIPSGNHDVVLLDGWKDCVIDAYGVTIIASDQNWPSSIFDMRNCVNVTLAGPLLSQTQITAHQGKVTAVDPGDGSSKHFSCTWTSDAGYPAMVPNATKFPAIDVVDSRTRKLKVGTGDFYSVTGTSLEGNAFQLTGFGDKPNIAVGDWLVARRDTTIANKIHLDGCERCTVRDVSMMRNGFAPIFETGGAGGNHILGCKWLLGPKPAGAIEAPLVSGAADGLHSVNTATGPDIEHCVMEGILLDDCFAVHGSFQDVASVSSGALVVKNGGAGLAVGQPIRCCDKDGFYAEATVTALKDNGDQTTSVTLDHAINPPATGLKVFNPLHCGAGYRILNNILGNTRSRGILVKGDTGLIQGNTISDCQMSAVSIGPEFYWGEAGYVKHVTVAGNRISRCGGAVYGGEAILVHGDGSIGNSDITIRDNQFVDDVQGEFRIDCASGVTIAGNHVLGCLPWPSGLRAPAFVSVTNSRTVALANNVVKNPGVYQPPLVTVGQNVTDITGNDGSGVREARL